VPSGILPDEGIGDELSYILKAPLAGVANWQMILWVNDLVPSFDTVFSDLEESTWGGYSRVQLDRSVWTDPDVSQGCATSTWGTDPISFDVSDPMDQTIFGVAYYDPTKGVLRFIQRFDDADIAPLELGQQFQILPVYTLTSAACSSSMQRAKRKVRMAKGEKKRG